MKFSEKEEARKRRKEVGKSSKQRKIGGMSYRTGKHHPFTWAPFAAWRKASHEPLLMFEVGNEFTIQKRPHFCAKRLITLGVVKGFSPLLFIRQMF